MKPFLALLLLVTLAACGTASAPSVEGGVYMGTFWRG